MPETEVTADGWSVPNWNYFRLITDHEPPRPYGPWVQLKEDAKIPGPLAFWFAGGASVAIGVASGRWPNLILGLILGVPVLALWLVMFLRAVRYLRSCPSGVGVIDALGPHPLSRRLSTATAVTASGQKVRIGLPTALGSGLIDGAGRAEVLFLHDPRSAYCLVFAVRPLPGATPTPSGSGSD